MAASLHISLPEGLKGYVDAQTETGEFATPSEYISALIREDQQRQQKWLEKHVLAALAEESEAVEIPEELLEDGDLYGWIEDVARRSR